MHIIGTIVIGFLAGLIAKFLMPGRDPGGFMVPADRLTEIGCDESADDSEQDRNAVRTKARASLAPLLGRSSCWSFTD
jgi:hypothetical protein